ncbi:MAG: hypothetical protein LLG04_11855 [Parachlamydia sp.]|nr:hypothetical protein [Parachlamydia sp.]
MEEKTSAIGSCHHCHTQLEGKCIAYTKDNQTTHLHQRCDQAWKESQSVKPTAAPPPALQGRNIQPVEPTDLEKATAMFAVGTGALAVIVVVAKYGFPMLDVLVQHMPYQGWCMLGAFASAAFMHRFGYGGYRY